MRDDDIWTHIDAERADLAGFLDSLTPDQWALSGRNSAVAPRV